jgi:hypothetical protein
MGAAVTNSSLVDVALVSDLPGVELRGFSEDEQPFYALGGAAALRGEALQGGGQVGAQGLLRHAFGVDPLGMVGVQPHHRADVLAVLPADDRSGE